MGEMMVTEQQPPEDQATESQPAGVTAEPTGAPDQSSAERQRLLEQRAQLEEQLRALGPDTADEPFTRSSWGGRDLFTCKYCPDTAWSEDDIRAHVDDDARRDIHRAHPEFPG